MPTGSYPFSDIYVKIAVGWDIVVRPVVDFASKFLPVHWVDYGSGSGAIVGDAYEQAFEKGSTAFGTAWSVVIPEGGTVAAEDLAYRYMGEEEASIVETNGGIIPNVNRAGDPKNVFTSPNLYDSVSEAEGGLGIGRLDPRGTYPSPQYRATYLRNSVTYTYAGTVEGRSGIEMITRQEIQVIRVEKLIPY